MMEAGQAQRGNITWDGIKAAITRARRRSAGASFANTSAPALADLAEMDDLVREQRRLDALALRREKDELAALDADVQTLSDTADILARAAMLAAGYHQHKRGEWRKRRGRKESD